MIPSRRLLWLAALWPPIGLAPVLVRALLPEWWNQALWLWLGCGLALAITALLDALAGRRLPTPAATRLLPAAFSVQVPHPVRIRLESAALPRQCRISDDHPADDGDTGLPVTVVRSDRDTTEVRYRYRPSQRGRARFGDIQIERPSPLGLWQVRRRIPCAAEVPVYPDFSMLAERFDPARAQLHDIGLRRRSRRGDGLEFHQLRDYQPGDSLRRIDWKATARKRRLISREYQEEQNQPLLLLLDGGDRLALPVAGLTGFDHGLNAGLLLAWNALLEGDRPGAMVFSGASERWVPPVRGRRGINNLLTALYDLQPGSQATDFTDVARRLETHWRRRALVVLITRLQPDDLDDLKTALALLRRRHLVIIADMQMPARMALGQREIRDFDDALLVAGDAIYEEERQALYTRLRHAGAVIVDATPSQLPGRLNATYLALKRAGRI